MTKEQEIRNKANGYAFDMDEGDLNTNRDIFIAGAEWADKTLIEKVLSEIKRLREKDYPTDTFEEAAGYYSALDDIERFLKDENGETCST